MSANPPGITPVGLTLPLNDARSGSWRSVDRMLRAMDLTLAGFALLVLAIPMGLTFWTGRRTRVLVNGQFGRPFERSIWRPSAGHLGRLGRCLRALGPGRWVLLVHILRGQMAFVGPRARIVGEPVPVATLGVRPGLVNPWFIRRRTRVDFGTEAQADADYLAHRGVGHDLGLLVRGILVALLPKPLEQFPIRVRVGDVGFDNLDMQEALAALDRMLAGTSTQQVMFVNPACVNIAARHRGYRRALSRAALVLPDGIGIKIGSDLLGTPLKQNVNGTDLFPRLCDLLAARGASLFLLGGGAGVAQAVAARIAQEWPQIRVVGARDGYFSVAEEGGVVAQIRSSGADCLLVARGVPAQDLLIDRYLPLLGVKVALGVGGLFDFVSGRLLRAPVWMRETGLEWAFRLLQEPRRLWRRYLVGNLTFMGRIWLQRAGLRQTPNDSVGARRDHFFAKPSYFSEALPDLNPTIDSRSNGPPGMVARGLAALAIGGIALLGSGMRLASRRPASGSDLRFSHLIRLRAELAEVVTGTRCWFGIRRRSPAQWSRLPREWQLILRRQSVGVFHAPAWSDGTEFDEEACAAADVFWAVGSAGTRFWTLVSSVSARVRLRRSVAVGGRESVALK
jgi:N-acetylglucosaminyldiphosphoundecaprenol N-acetyl-beta-D-mannosaminyltransferase